jgi:tetratricopeptide (TPR) repeat protein
MLGRCYFSLQQFHDAAEQYEHILQMVGDSSTRARLMRMCAHESLALCLRQAGDLGNAVQILRQCICEFPDVKRLNRQLAELYADIGDYVAAYEALQREVSLEPQLEQDVSTRIAMALGPIAKDPGGTLRAVKQYLEAHPEVARLLDSLHRFHWPTFANLCEQSREEWCTGMYQLYCDSLRQAEFRPRLFEDAVKHFGKAVELEVRSRVFKKFREEVSTKSGTPVPPQVDLQKYSWLRNLTAFVTSEDVNLNLEKMTAIIKNSKKSSLPLAASFSAWLQQTQSELIKKTYLLEYILGPLGDAKHESMSEEAAKKVALWCRQVLDALA